MPHLPPLGDDLLSAVQQYLSSLWVGLFDNAVDADLVTGVALAGGGGVPGADPLEEVSAAEVPGYAASYPGDWALTVVSPTVLRLTGTASWTCSEAPETPVPCYGYFVAFPQQGGDVALVGFSQADPDDPPTFVGAGDTITMPVSLLISQPDPGGPAQVTVDGGGASFVGNAGGKEPVDVHTMSDVQFVKFLNRALARVAGHDQRAQRAKTGASRTSPLTIVGQDVKGAQAVAWLRQKTSALHQLWTRKPLV